MSEGVLNTDNYLIQRVAEGSEQALSILFERYWERLYLGAYRKLADDQGAREIVNDVFLELWRLRGQREISNVGAYLGKAVNNRVINKLVGKKDAYFFDILETHGTSLYHADQAILQKDLLELIKSWIETLPARRQEIFVRYYYDHLSTAEIAEQLGISEKTVQNQLSLAVQFLRANYRHLLPAFLLMEAILQKN